MNDEVEKTGKVICKYIAHIIVSVVAMFILLWTIYFGYDFATKPHRDGKYNRSALSIGAATIVLGITFVTIYIGYDFATKPHRDGKYNRYALSIGAATIVIGAATIVLGITFVTIGLAIVADLVLNLTSQQQQEEKRIEIQQDGAARYRKQIIKDIARFIATVISMLLLTWAIYDGIRLATAPGQDGKIDHLAFRVEVVTIAFGTIYLIIGLSIVADLAVNLSSVLKRLEDKKKIFTIVAMTTITTRLMFEIFQYCV